MPIGDQVIFQTTDNNKGIVTALLERDNSLKRSNKLCQITCIALGVDVACF
jgi:putative ribosome biogenesis GTPase RsgA